MPPKRKRRASPAPTGLATGEQLKRAKLAAGQSSTWGWVDTQVSDPSQITLEHRLMTCGLSIRNKNAFCGNRHAPKPTKSSPPPTDETQTTIANGELENDVIVVSDDEPPPCNKKVCKNNPNCLNYLGQDQWEDQGKPQPSGRVYRAPSNPRRVFSPETARQLFIKASDLSLNPILSSRDPELPVGLKVGCGLVHDFMQIIFVHATQNLGATCYANAFLQVCILGYVPGVAPHQGLEVWFRDLAFRRGVYQCQPSHDTENSSEVCNLLL